MRILTSVVVLAGLCSCSESTSRTGSLPGTGYTLGNPHGWEQKSGLMGTDLILLSPQEGAGDSFRENVNVTVEKVPKPLSHQGYVDASAASLKKTLSLKDEFTYKPTSVNGVSGYVAQIRHRMGVFDLVLDSYIVIQGDTSYIISCTATEESYDSYRDKFAKIVSTFSLN